MPNDSTAPQRLEKDDQSGHQDEEVGIETEEEAQERLRPPEESQGMRDAEDATFEPDGGERTAS